MSKSGSLPDRVKSSLTSGGPADHFRVAGTSSHFAVVRSSSAGNVEITVRGPSEALLQVTVIPGAADSANIEFSATLTVLLMAIFGSAPGFARSRGSLFDSRRLGGSPSSRRWRAPYSGRPIRSARCDWDRLQFWNRRLVRGRRSLFATNPARGRSRERRAGDPQADGR